MNTWRRPVELPACSEKKKAEKHNAEYSSLSHSILQGLATRYPRSHFLRSAEISRHLRNFDLWNEKSGCPNFLRLALIRLQCRCKCKGINYRITSWKTFTKEILTAFDSSYISKNVSYYDLSKIKKKKSNFCSRLVFYNTHFCFMIQSVYSQACANHQTSEIPLTF